MNYKVILNLLGKVSVILAALMVLPLVAALIYGEAIWWTYLATSGIALAVGLPVTLFVKPDNKAIYSREGLVVVSLAWIYASVISTVPLMLSGAIPSFVDALFEMVSAFGTVGLSTGITPGLGVAAKLLSIVMMYIGRLGPMTIATVWYFSRGERVRFPEGNIAIG